MKNRRMVGLLCLMTVLLAHNGTAIAHGTEKHDNAAAGDAQMKKLHAMMPMFSLASAGLETALEKGNIAAVEAEAGKILSALPDLKKSKPHKNINQRKKFVSIAANLESATASTLDLAKKGDFSGAKAAFKRAEEACAACHAKFRD